MMKILLKSLLFICILLAVVYAAVPLWLSPVVESRLPSGWKLHALETGYPGLSGLNVRLLRVTMTSRAVVMSVAINDARLNYGGAGTLIDTVTAEVFVAPGGKRNFIALDDLSLPVLTIPDDLPDFRINSLRVALHPDVDDEAGNPIEPIPQVLHFTGTRLLSRADGGVTLTARLGLEGQPAVAGLLSLNARHQTVDADLRLVTTAQTEPWLRLSVRQETAPSGVSTLVHALADTRQVDRRWLDQLRGASARDALSNVEGHLEIVTGFKGMTRQRIDHMTLTARDFRLETPGRAIQINGLVTAGIDTDSMVFTADEPVKVRYEDRAGDLARHVQRVVPTVQLESLAAPGVSILLTGSGKLVIPVEVGGHAKMDGDLAVGITYQNGQLDLAANDLRMESADLVALDKARVDTTLAINWLENGAVRFQTNDLELQASALSLAYTGRLQMDAGQLGIESIDDFDLRLVNTQGGLESATQRDEVQAKLLSIRGRLGAKYVMSDPVEPLDLRFDGNLELVAPLLKLQTGESTVDRSISAGQFSVEANLEARGGTWITSGQGVLTEALVEPFNVMSKQVDITWRGFDIFGLTGDMGGLTRGFSGVFNGVSLQGFDFELSFGLSPGSQINGNGFMNIKTGNIIPIKFSYDLDTASGKADLARTTFTSEVLAEMLRMTLGPQLETVQLNAGSVDLEGDVTWSEAPRFNFVTGGRDLHISVLESDIKKAGFELNIRHDERLYANGPIHADAVALAGGIDVSDFSAVLTIDSSDQAVFENVLGRLFGGELKISSATLVAGDLQDTTIGMTGVDLSLVLQYLDIKGLEGSGRLDLVLPVGTDSGRIFLKAGTFQSSIPGYLAYRNRNLVNDNIGLQALEDFQYQSLSGRIDYDKNGAYRLGIRLEGNNPALYDGYPIVLNLNLSGALPALFESLFLTGDFEEALLKEISSGRDG